LRDRGVGAAFGSVVTDFFLFLLATALMSIIFAGVGLLAAGRPPDSVEDEAPPPDPKNSRRDGVEAGVFL
jgi:hypothetical protein